MALIDQAVDKTPKVSKVEQVYGSPQLEAIFVGADKTAKELGDQYTSTDAMFLSLTQSSALASILFQAGLTNKDIKDALLKLRKSQNIASKSPGQSMNALDKYTRNITKEAKDGKLDPVIGRDSEIRRTIQVLSRRTISRRI